MNDDYLLVMMKQIKKKEKDSENEEPDEVSRLTMERLAELT